MLEIEIMRMVKGVGDTRVESLPSVNRCVLKVKSCLERVLITPALQGFTGIKGIHERMSGVTDSRIVSAVLSRSTSGCAICRLYDMLIQFYP